MKKNNIFSLFGVDKIIQNKGVKYSELLEKLMKPFEKELTQMEDVETIFEFAINVWNSGNMKIILKENQTEEVINSFL